MNAFAERAIRARELSASTEQLEETVAALQLALESLRHYVRHTCPAKDRDRARQAYLQLCTLAGQIEML